MASYSFPLIINQTISFNAADNLNFGVMSATEVSVHQVGNDLAVVTTLGTVRLANFSIAKLTANNFTFGDGSRFVVGDLTENDTLDAGSNSIDFSTNATISSSLNSNNHVYGHSGTDTIIAGNGDNLIYGGRSEVDSADGADAITVGNGSNTIYANGGNDVITFSSATSVGEVLRFYGGAGNDTITSSGATGSLQLYGNDGNDTFNITSASGNATVYGGVGTDTLNFTSSIGDVLAFGGVSEADPTDGADTITSGSGNLTLYSNGGADNITLNTTASKVATVYSGAGNDIITANANAGSLLLYAGAGSDNINLSTHTGNATIYGGSAMADPGDSGDTITAGVGGNVLIYANGGNDNITVTPAGGTVATIYAGAGNDTVSAAFAGVGASVQITGGEGNDRFKFSFPTVDSNYTIHDFGNGTDVLDVTLGGGSAADIALLQANGNTTLQRGGNYVTLTNYSGNFSATTVVGDINSILATNFGGVASSLAGGAGNDQLIAGSNGDTLVAGVGNDKLTGGTGNDTFSIAASAFSSSDTITGGEGTDTLLFSAAGAAVLDAQFAGTGSVEVLKLSGADFTASTITLGTFANGTGITTIDASALAGSNGSTINASAIGRGIVFSGGAGVDNFTGSAMADSIVGGAGADILTGGLGADTMTGGAGADIFVYNAASASVASEIGDRITDFDAGTSSTAVDILRFSASALNYNLGNGDAAVTGAVISSITAAGAANTDLVILNTVGIATANITSSLDTINSLIAPGAVINAFFDTTRGHAVVYLDTNGSQAGGHLQVAELTNVTTVGGMANFDFSDFSFT